MTSGESVPTTLARRLPADRTIGPGNPQSDALRLSDELDGQHIRVTLHRVKPNFILQSRGLQRINESAILGTLSL